MPGSEQPNLGRDIGLSRLNPRVSHRADQTKKKNKGEISLKTPGEEECCWGFIDKLDYCLRRDRCQQLLVQEIVKWGYHQSKEIWRFHLQSRFSASSDGFKAIHVELSKEDNLI